MLTFDDNFLDWISILSFSIGIANYAENITQTDMQELTKEVDNKTSTLLSELHGHLEKQDKKIDNILQILGGNANDL